MRIFIAFLLFVLSFSASAQLPVWAPSSPLTFDRSLADTGTLQTLYTAHWKKLGRVDYTKELKALKVYEAAVSDSLAKIAGPGFEKDLAMQKKWNEVYQQQYEESLVQISQVDAQSAGKVARALRQQLDALERSNSKTLHYTRRDTGKLKEVYFYEVKRKLERVWVYYMQSPQDPKTGVLRMVARFNVLSSGWKMSTTPAGGLSASDSPLGFFSMSGDLGGRKLLKRPAMQQVHDKTGFVTISICVDENGAVSSAEYTQKGSTSSDPELKNLAIQLAKGFVFEKAAGSLNCGAIRFVFK